MARRESYRQQALVVRTYDFGEADRVVVLLTKERGIVRAVARGVRRAKSRFGSRLQPFVVLDVQLYPGRSLHTITAADTVEYLGSVIDDYERYTAACAVLATAERFALAAEGDSFLFHAACTALHQLARSSEVQQRGEASTGAVSPTLILDQFLLQAMEHEGFGPSLFDCAGCGTPGPHHHFNALTGGAVCTHCLPGTAVEPDALRVMWRLMHGLDVGVISPTLGTTVHSLTRAHLRTHLERGVAAVDLVAQ